MKTRLALIVVGLLACSAALAEQDPAALAARAAELLVKADFAAAAEQYATAAKLAPDVEAYQHQARLVERVVELRKRLETLDLKSAGWTRVAAALHAFYLDNRIYGEALKIDRALYEVDKSPAVAASLARTELALNMHDDAAELLSALAADQHTPETRVLLGIAWARQGKADAAREIAGQQTETKATAEQCVDRAQLLALLGDTPGALAQVRAALEETHPMRLDAVRTSIQTCGDFKTLADDPEFAAALKTESKMKVSGCSSGSSCGNCPSKSKCSSTGEKKH